MAQSHLDRLCGHSIKHTFHAGDVLTLHCVLAIGHKYAHESRYGYRWIKLVKTWIMKEPW
jgi:hypothetical protein